MRNSFASQPASNCCFSSLISPGSPSAIAARKVPCLSILDLLMLNPVAAVREATEMFRLSPN